MIEEFNKNKYIVIRNAIDKKFLKMIESYFLYSELQTPDSRDGQVPTAYSRYGDPMTESILNYLMGRIEKETGLELLPSYSFYRIYRRGDFLKPHKDRPACEISATLCLGYSYNDNEYNWPIVVDGKEYNLFPGDMAVYRGLECAHWRNKFNPPDKKDYQIQTFLHYVDKNGPHAEWLYDKRKGIGYSYATKHL